MIKPDQFVRADAAQKTDAIGRAQIGDEPGQFAILLAASGEDQLRSGDRGRDERSDQPGVIFVRPDRRRVNENVPGRCRAPRIALS